MKQINNKKHRLQNAYRIRNGLISRQAIKDIAKRIAAEFVVEKIILFGSQCYGTPTKTSDVDLLVVIETTERHSELRYKMYTVLEDVSFPIDIIVREPQQLETAYQRRDWFLQDIIEKGQIIYGK